MSKESNIAENATVQTRSNKRVQGRRSRGDRALAEQYRRRLMRTLADRSAEEAPVFRLPTDALRPLGPDAIWDKIADRMLDVIEREREQPLPFDQAAGRHERATLRLVRCDGDAPLR